MIKLELISSNEGKYYVKGQEVYVYNHIGPHLVEIGVRAEPGNLPPVNEVLKRGLTNAFASILKNHPGKEKHTNGFIILNSEGRAKKESIRNGEDAITLEERGRVNLQFCTYSPKTPENKRKLEEVFGEGVF